MIDWPSLLKQKEMICAMKIIFVSLLCFLVTFTPQFSLAQKATIDIISKESETGEVVGCGMELSATDGTANGIHTQIILYSLGNLNWELGVYIMAGKISEEESFVQENVIDASIMNDKIGEIYIIRGGKNVTQKSMENRYPVSAIQHLLESGFSIYYKTESKDNGYLQIPPSKEKLAEYRDGCYNEMAGMIREHYRDYHGDTKCLDDPTSC